MEMLTLIALVLFAVLVVAWAFLPASTSTGIADQDAKHAAPSTASQHA